MTNRKRKIVECHYCESQIRHERKQTKLMIPIKDNFKCRGRGGEEIPWPADLRPSSRGVQISVDEPKPNDHATRKPPMEMSRNDGEGRKESTIDRCAPLTNQPAQTPTKRIHDRILTAEVTSKTSRRPKNESHVSSGGQANSNNCRTVKRKEMKRDSLTKIAKAPLNAYELGYDGKESQNSGSAESYVDDDCSILTVTVSNDSMSTYLDHVSKDLQRERLLGKLCLNKQAADRVKCSNDMRTNLTKLANKDSLLQNRSKNSFDSTCFESVDETQENRFTVWTKLVYLFSLGCWRGIDIPFCPGSQTSNEKCGSYFSSSSSSESSSTSTATATVATRSDRHRKSAESPSKTTRLRPSSKFAVVRLVDSLKKFFRKQTDEYNLELVENEEKPIFDRKLRMCGTEDDVQSDFSSGSEEDTDTTDSLVHPQPSCPRYGGTDFEIVDVRPTHRQPL